MAHIGIDRTLNPNKTGYFMHSDSRQQIRPRQSLSTKAFAARSIAALLLFIILIAVCLRIKPFANTIAKGDDLGAKEALSLLKDTTVWLASIQTATLAALGLLAKDGITSLKLTTHQMRLVIWLVILDSFALFFSAWILTALPAAMLRIYSDKQKYDFFNLPIYNSVTDTPFNNTLTINFFVTCNHWLWAGAVLVFGVLCVSIAISRVEKAEANPPQAEPYGERPSR